MAHDAPAAAPAAAPDATRALRVLDAADPRDAHWRDLYRDLHAHPELSGREHRTAAALAAELRASGLEVTEGVGGTGVVGLLRNGDGPVVMLRADMDGLPVHEETGLPYASRHTDVNPAGETVFTMHACGHDMHVTALAAAVDALAGARDAWRGTLLVVGQPAEETAAGARAMLEDGLFTRFPKPDVALGQHVGPLPAGVANHSRELLMAAACTLDVTIHGRGGHGSRPHVTVDPVLTAAYAVTRLQAIVSRETSPEDPVVVTVGTFHAGTKSNIIPDTATFTVNLRARSDASMERAVAAVRRVVEAESAAAGCPQPPTIGMRENPPATVNTAAVVDRVMAAQRAVMPEGAVRLAEPLMGSEDFSEYGLPKGRYDGDPVPYAFWFWGGMDPALFPEGYAAGFSPAVPGNHTAQFAPLDEPTIAAGRRLLVAAALEFLA
ncbi:putative amidohydrolase [Cellulomonas hominis]|uniref:Hippurate hydrolase n=1 Tax=Cellulomonas hominis TaxID=156981 RepID=A0A511FE27_9CELL|nr:amidohydrolase [Cellulomonas hominis]MBB5474540.1 hippurate hydrolase [Cellulomonas hominis]GEL46577.1 putative amidohydrolase [Cellulomonas hominis]